MNAVAVFLDHGIVEAQFYNKISLLAFAGENVLHDRGKSAHFHGQHTHGRLQYVSFRTHATDNNTPAIILIGLK